jgi:sugar lactone lactonase YvrE
VRDLYITSSRLEMDADALARVRCAGGVFRADPHCRGIVDQMFEDGPAGARLY